MDENIPSLVKYINLQIQEAEQAPNSRNPKISIPRHIISYLLKTKDKEKMWKTAREKQHITYRRIPIRVTVDFHQKPWSPEGSDTTFLRY